MVGFFGRRGKRQWENINVRVASAEAYVLISASSANGRMFATDIKERGRTSCVRINAVNVLTETFVMRERKTV
jgi:hypothetical protein